MIEASGREASVSLLPFQKNVGDYFATADVFVNLSFHEGLPNTVLENVLCGNRVVVSDIPEHRDILGEHYPYYVQDPKDPAQAADVIAAAISNRIVGKEMHAAHECLRSMSPAAVTDSYVNVFEEVAQKCYAN
jgi:glycosyltransferase involved in cell wall biosynthesis